jgi:hypothetical protein
MRLFKAKEPERSEEDEAAAMRLMAITNRIRPASSNHPEESPAPDDPEEREDPE